MTTQIAKTKTVIILASCHHKAKYVADKLLLSPCEWRYAASIESLRGLNSDNACWFWHGSADINPDAESILEDVECRGLAEYER